MPGMKWIGPIVFSKSSGNPIFGHIFAHQRARNEARNTKMNRGQETHPIRVNATYEINWANSFFSKSSGILVYRRMDGRTNGRTDIGGESSIPLFHLWWSGGIMMHWLWVYAIIGLCTHNNARHNICTHWHDEVFSLYSVGPSIWFIQPYSSGLLHLLPNVDITSKL